MYPAAVMVAPGEQRLSILPLLCLSGGGGFVSVCRLSFSGGDVSA